MLPEHEKLPCMFWQAQSTASWTAVWFAERFATQARLSSADGGQGGSPPVGTAALRALNCRMARLHLIGLYARRRARVE